MTEKISRADLTKTKIITAAIKLINENGYSNVSIRDICKESGVSLSRINYHFGNKDNLAVELAIQMPIKMNNEIMRRHPGYNTPRTMESDLAFLVLLIRVLLSEGESIKKYREMYSQNAVLEHIIESSRFSYQDYYSEDFRKSLTPQMLIVVSNACAQCMATLLKEDNLPIMQNDVEGTVSAVCEFIMNLVRIPKTEQEEIMRKTHALVDDIKFEVKGITEITFPN